MKAELPDFGDYHIERVSANLADNQSRGSPVEEYSAETAADFTPVNSVDLSQVPSVAQLVGTALPHLTDHMKLSTEEHVVAKVNDDLCINCGRCMLTCNDTGYQAISFSTDSHKVEIKDECTGCGLCGTVCPVAGCIDFVPRETEYNIYRGVVTEDNQIPPEILKPVAPPQDPAWRRNEEPVIRSPGYQ